VVARFVHDRGEHERADLGDDDPWDWDAAPYESMISLLDDDYLGGA